MIDGLMKQIGRTTVGSLTIFVVLCIVGVGIWLGIERLDLRSEVSSWQARYDSLADDKSQLDEDYQLLQTEMQEISGQEDGLQSKYDSLAHDYDLLTSTHQTLQAQKDALQVDYSELLSEKNSIQADYDTLTTWYSGIREEVNRRLGDWEDKKSFVTPDDAAVVARVQAVTGGFSENVSEQWADFKSMYDWVVDNIEYNSDTRLPRLPLANGSLSWQHDYWRMPSETLEDEVGDCEDMATLLASMILNYTSSAGYPCWCITWVSDDSAHAAVAFPVSGDKLTILDPAGNNYTGWPLALTNEDVSTAVDDWLAHWLPEPGILVSGIFSDTVYETFDSTDEFVNWVLANY